jgi:hypothetical protein
VYDGHLGKGKNYITVGIKKRSAARASLRLYVFRFINGRAFLSINIKIGKGKGNPEFRKFIIDNNLLQEITRLEKYRIHISDISNDLIHRLCEVAGSFVQEVGKSQKSRGHSPDDYMENNAECKDDLSMKARSESYQISSSDISYTVESKEIFVSQNEKKLTKSFVSWVNSEVKYKVCRLEQKANDRDRIDVVLNDGKNTIYAELKSVNSYSENPKRAIRAGLGQILDYQFFDGMPTAKELWIVIDKCSDEDIESVKLFIDSLNAHLVNLNLRVLVQKKSGIFELINL